MRAPRRGRWCVIVAAQIAVGTGGCASVPRSSALSDDALGAPMRHEQPSIAGAATLTRADLASTNEWSTMDAVRRLRPDFLRGSARGPLTGPPQVAVYLNGAYDGDVSVLNSIPLAVIAEIAFLHPVAARQRFGSTCPCANGAIVVTIPTQSRR
jgi:hypothetical protein